MTQLTPEWRWNAAMIGLVWGTGARRWSPWGAGGGQPSVMKIEVAEHADAGVGGLGQLTDFFGLKSTQYSRIPVWRGRFREYRRHHWCAHTHVRAGNTHAHASNFFEAKAEALRGPLLIST